MISCKKSVIPQPAFGCGCTSESTVYVQDGDISQLQFGLTPVNNINLAPSLDPVASGTNTSVSASKLINTSGNFQNGNLQVNYTVKNITDNSYALVTAIDSNTQLSLSADIFTGTGKSYEIIEWSLAGMTYDHTTNSLVFDNSCLATGYNFLKDNTYYKIIATTDSGGASSGLLMTFGDTQLVSINGNVTDVAYFKFSDGDDILLADNVSFGSLILSRFEIYEMSQIAYKIKDCDTDSVVYDANGGLEYYQSILSTDYQNEDLPVIGQVSINWENIGLDEGCYKICFIDSGLLGFDFLRNGDFDDSWKWVIENSASLGWVITGGEAVHTGEASGDDDYISQTITALDPTLDYTLRIEPDLNILPDDDLLIYIDSSETGADYLLYTIVQGTTTPVEIDFTGYSVTKIKIGMFQGGDGSFDNVTLKVDSELECSCESMCISYRNAHTFTDGCNVLLTAYNDNSAIGYDFENFDFKHYLRVPANLRNGKYEFIDEEYYKKSNGEKLLVSSGYEKYKELQIYQIPEALHDIISLMLMHQHFTITIDGEEVEFVKRPGGLTPNWVKQTADAPFIVEVTEKTQDYYNYLGS